MKEKYIQFSKNKNYNQCLNHLLKLDIKTNLSIIELTLKEFNKEYRETGKSDISDSAYDALLDVYTMYVPNNNVNQNWNSTELPITMTGLSAIKNHNQYLNWLRTKGIKDDNLIVLSYKLDGGSLLVDESNKQVWTGGEKSKRVETHYKHINHGKDTIMNCYTYGEIIVSRKNFEKYEDEEIDGKTYTNARNMVSGLFNSKSISNALKDVDYIRYGFVPKDSNVKLNKSEQLDLLNTHFNSIPVKYKVLKASEITFELITELYNEWSVDYEIDGIVLDVDDFNLREKLGRSNSQTEPIPNYTMKYKGNFEEVKETKIIKLHSEISKLGTFTPVFYIEPTILNKATVNKVTGNNFKHVNDFKIKVGDTIKIKRSGMVIPKIIQVGNTIIPFEEEFENKTEYLKAKKLAIKERENESVELFDFCPECGSPTEWNETEVHLQCSNLNCSGIALKRLISFFRTMEVEDFSSSTITQFYENGYDTIKKILEMKISDMLVLDRFAEAKANKIYENIHSKMKNVNLSKLQHASGYFRLLGERKLELINSCDIKTKQNLLEVDGLQEKTINTYLKGIEAFNEFVKTVPITINTKKESKQLTSDKFKNTTIVFTGVRDKDLEQYITDNGGIIGSGISNKTNILICKDKNSGSSKLTKASELGIKIYELDEFKNSLK